MAVFILNERKFQNTYVRVYLRRFVVYNRYVVRGDNVLPSKNSYVYIYSYKHDGSLHRTWTKGYVLEADEDKCIVVNNKTLVSESDGRKWFTREPAIWFFFPKLWFNAICMIRKTGVYYYCNLASPYLYDKEAIKYIDYEKHTMIYLKVLKEKKLHLMKKKLWNYILNT